MHKDMMDNKICVGDDVVYGKSSRYQPIKLGVVKEIVDAGVIVLGEGNSKTGLIQNPEQRMISLTSITNEAPRIL